MKLLNTLVHATLLLIARSVLADVELVTPASGATLAGGAMTLTWQDSGALPALVSISASDIILCTGTNAAPQTLYTLAGAVALGSKTSLAVTIPITIGASGQYFIKFVSTTADGYVVTTYSDRFTLTGMTGTLVANSGLAVTGPAGTTPAAALTESAAATAKPTVATTGVATSAGAAVASAGSVDLLAYLTQTGSTRTGPAQELPGTKITAVAGNAKPLFPTSAYTIFTTFGPAPLAVTTLTASPTWTVTSFVNGAPPASFTGN